MFIGASTNHFIYPQLKLIKLMKTSKVGLANPGEIGSELAKKDRSSSNT
ncbi:hypothetical protein M5D96_005786, partial [Drosophila gunungcola]